MNSPLVSVIIPVYNREHLILETLHSVKNQSYTNFECIIVDDGSTDATKEIIAQFCEKDQRFKLFDRPEDRLSGGNAARNFGFEKSTGAYINWLDSDDLIHTEKLEKQMALLLNHKESNVVVCQTVNFPGVEDVFNRCIIPKTNNVIHEYLRAKFRFQTNAPIFKRAFLEKHGILFNEHLKRGQEYEFFGKLIPYMRFVKTDEVLVYRRRNENTISGSSKSNTYYKEFFGARKSLFLAYKKEGFLNLSSKLFFYNSFNSIKNLSNGHVKLHIGEFIAEQFNSRQKVLFRVILKFKSFLFKLTGYKINI